MRLHDFVADHPGCRTGRPDLLTPLALTATLGVLALVALAAAVDAVAGGEIATALVPVPVIAGALWPLPVLARRAGEAFALWRRGHASWALADEDLLLVDGNGTAVIIALDQVTHLEIDAEELRLRVDSELQGVVYAVLFDLFDEGLPRPSARALFDALAPRLTRAVIVRGDDQASETVGFG
jgi:hypothetical protein